MNSVGKRFKFIVKAFSSFAEDGVSSIISQSIILAGAPDKPPVAPTRNVATSEFVLSVNLVPVPGDNGSTITSYNVEFDDGKGGTFVEIKGETHPDLTLTATVTSGAVKGRRYRFRYRALNEVGFGPYSEIAYILSASAPDEPSVISAQLVGSNIVISWQLPNNKASLIERAEIKIMHSDGVSFSTQLTHCDGGNKSVFDARACSIPAAVLRASPYSLAQGDPISPIIRFKNEIGFSDWSQNVDTLLLMSDVPHAPTETPSRLEELCINQCAYWCCYWWCKYTFLQHTNRHNRRWQWTLDRCSRLHKRRHLTLCCGDPAHCGSKLLL